MKPSQLIFLPFLFLISIFSCNAQSGPALQPKEYSEKCFDKNAVLLDVRTPEEYSEAHLKGAILINYLDQKTFNEGIAKLDKSKTVYVYCRSGGRSGYSQEIMLKQGFKSVINLDGGIDAWKKAGLPVEK